MSEAADDDWITLDPATRRPHGRDDVVVSIAETKSGSFRASITIRGSAYDFFDASNRWEVSIGGGDVNLIRLRPADSNGFIIGRHKERPSKWARIVLGRVNVWPAEVRPATKAIFSIKEDSAVLVLPKSWARPHKAHSSTDTLIERKK